MSGQWPQHGSGRLDHGSGLFRDMMDEHFFRDPFANDPFFTQPFGGSLLQSFLGRTRPQPHGTSLLESFFGGTGMGFPSASRQRREQDVYHEELCGPMIEEMPHDDATGASGVPASNQQHIVEEPDDTEEEKAENARLKELLALEQAAASSHHYAPQIPRQPSVRNIVVTDGPSAVSCASTTSTYMYDGSGPGRFQSITTVSSVGPDGVRQQRWVEDSAEPRHHRGTLDDQGGRSAVRKRGGEAEERVTARGQPARAGASFRFGRHLGQQNGGSRQYSGVGD